MKKFLSILLLTATLFAVCSVLGSCNGDTAAAGLIEADGKTYFIAAGGTVVIENGNAKPADGGAVSGTPVSKKFDAPDTTEDYFVYSEINGKINITGLTEAGKAQSVIILPQTIGGKEVALVSAGALDGLDSLIIATPKSAITISDNAFSGVKNVYLATDPATVTVGANLFSSTTGVNVFVCADEYSDYKSHYNWGAHSDKLTAY